MMLRVLVVTLGLVVGAAGVAAADGASVGSRAPEFDAAAKTLAGKKFRLKSLRGKWVAVTFGASWCKPCKDELPAWDRLAGQYGSKITFVAVNIDNDKKNRDRFLKKLKLKHMVVVHSPEDKTTTADAYLGSGDPRFPTTFVIDPRGVVRHVHAEYHKGDDKKLARAIDALIGDGR
jgi:cytochrome c biogenesis protein CcmG, thiol:disulfide interchange protein DsbE